MAKRDWELRTDPIEEWEVEGIRDGYRRGYTMQQLARLFETTRQNISLIVLNKSHYDPCYIPPETIKFRRDIRNKVRELWWDGMTYAEISNELEIDCVTIHKIIKNKSPYHDNDYIPPTESQIKCRQGRHKRISKMERELIIDLYSEGEYSQQKIADLLGFSQSFVSSVLKDRFPHENRYSDDDIRSIRILRKKGHSAADLAELYDCSVGFIYQIESRMVYKHVSDEQ